MFHAARPSASILLPGAVHLPSASTVIVALLRSVSPRACHIHIFTSTYEPVHAPHVRSGSCMMRSC